MFPASAPGYAPPAQFYPGAAHHGPPPAKKAKGNPIITRYSPPPGYVPPPQGQPHMPQTAFANPGFANPSYTAPPTYGAPQQQYSGYPAPFPSYGYAQPQPMVPQPSYSPPVHHGWQASMQPSQSAPPQVWSAPQQTPQYSAPHPRRTNSVPFAAHSHVATEPVDGNGDSVPRDEWSATFEQISAEWDPPVVPNDGHTAEFWEGCSFANCPNEIDPNLSIGQPVWHPAYSTQHPLPSTFNEVQPVPRPVGTTGSEQECVSKYINEKDEEYLLNVRLTDRFREIKDDPVFHELPKRAVQHLVMSELLDNFQNRPDSNWDAGRRSPSASPAPFVTHAQQSKIKDDDMDMDDSPNHRRERADRVSSLDGFEQGLRTRDSEFARSRSMHSRGNSYARSHSRANSASSFSSQKITRPVALPAVRDPAQEDLLAALGVTGAPRTVYQTPGPALGAPPPRARSRGSSTAPSGRHVSGDSNPDGVRGVPPPPPPPSGQPLHYFDTWDPTAGRQQLHSEKPWSRPTSSHSHHTAAGSDFYPEDNDATPRPRKTIAQSNGNATQNGNERNRKRSLEISEDEAQQRGFGGGRGGGNGGGNTPRRQFDDATPKQQRKKQLRQTPRVDEVYRYVRATTTPIGWNLPEHPNPRFYKHKTVRKRYEK